MLKHYIKKKKKFYFCVADPRDIIKAVNIPKKGMAQDFQRPWTEKRVKDLAKYIAGEDNLDLSSSASIENGSKKASGFLPTCPILNIKGNIQIIENNGRRFLEFPESAEEFNRCNGDVEIIDGQHRLIAFSDEYMDPLFKQNEIYEMGFIIFEKLTSNEKTELFVVTNDRAEKVDKNVLFNMMQWLGVLSDTDRCLFKLITALNTEDQSPLKGRINIDGSKKKNTFKLIQVKKILEKSGAYAELKKGDQLDKQVKLVSEYLNAWEEVYQVDFNKTRKPSTLEKISGFRYIMTLYPYIVKIMEKKEQTLTCRLIKPVLEQLKRNILTIEFLDNAQSMIAFRSETGTFNLAQKHGVRLIELNINKSGFNPFDI